MKKIAVVVQRYGLDVNGGSEYYARMLAEQLTKFYEVHVITTCANDYITWKDHYNPGIETINGVIVHRFLVDFERDIDKFNALDFVHTRRHSNKDEEKWVMAQGPVSSALIAYVKEHHKKYYRFILMTYLYYPTFKTMPIVANKAVFIPTAHDEAAINLRIFEENFKISSKMAYLTPEEKEFINKKFKNQAIPSSVIGSGLEIESLNFSTHTFSRPTPRRYVVYVGRIEESKGCGEMFDFFLNYAQRSGSDLPLILIGKPQMMIPKHPLVIPLGFVDEETKTQYIKHAECLIMPSYYESLSLVTLESMYLGVPPLVNGNCEVLKGHCTRSNGGLYYKNKNEFIFALDKLISNLNTREKLAQNGKNYVKENYTWNVAVDRLKKLMQI